MQLIAPGKAPRLTVVDIDGHPVAIGAATNRRTLLCFFRDPACPFCNYRIYELTYHHAGLSKLGLDVVAVFAATVDEVKRFVAKKPRPFPVIADADSTIYKAYGVERSSYWGKLKAICSRLPTLIKGLRIVSWAGLKTTNLMPADFLIDEHGQIAETWYGRDAGDRIPLERVELFLVHGLVEQAAA